MGENKQYNLVAENISVGPEQLRFQDDSGIGSTVVAEYTPKYAREEQYQSEADLERAFIKQLTEQAYEYLDITTEADLVENLRVQLEKLNKIQFTENEWKRFFESTIANSNANVADKTDLLQNETTQVNILRDDGTSKNVRLLDKKHIHNNVLQVINQYEVNPKDTSKTGDTAKRQNRYDVTILVNGLPMVHIELKRRGVDIREAFNQIERYKRDSFWAGSGLFEYVQLFVISNGTLTKYYSNTTRQQHIDDINKPGRKRNQTSHSYEFTSWWSDANNKNITDIRGFTETFFSKHTLLSVLTKYCVFTENKSLLVMRPYQIAATEKILQKVEISLNYKKQGTVGAGGYIWHTTGSGKTLTSFKTAQLISKKEDIKKVLFIVDRKDLDYQTMREYDNFEQGAANSNTSTAILKKQIEDPNSSIIITTIQKLDKFIKKNREHAIFGETIVLIFDECHRSQFGDMHRAIQKAFSKYILFGFTGTPIFAVNSSSGPRADLKTTVQAFGCYLHGDPKNCPVDKEGKPVNHQTAAHIYTIVDAIADKNVLSFRVEYYNTLKKADDIAKEKISAADFEAGTLKPERIEGIVDYILTHFEQKTKRDTKGFAHSRVVNVEEMVSAKDHPKVDEIKQAINIKGFNSIFVVSSIKAAKLYYNEFAKQQANLPAGRKLKVATIFSYAANEEVDDLAIDGLVDENNENTTGLDQSSRDFLDGAISDYNKMFKTNYDTSADKFPNYYKDISQRVKNREVDLLIVVNMFLTGFDATTLNTLWVDKNLQQHGLLQAFSRTNRILNSVKTFGMVVCFRNLEEAVNKSIALFGNKNASGIVLLKTYDEYYRGYEHEGKKVKGYKELIAELIQKYPVGERIIGEDNQKDFIRLYGEILRVQNILSTFDKFSDEGQPILSECDFQDYHSAYIDIYTEFRKMNESEKSNINDDLVFEMELIKQVNINIDFILQLIKKYHADNIKNKEVRSDISRAVRSNPDLRNKEDLIDEFISRLNADSDIETDWQTYITQKRKAELEELIESEKLNKEKTHRLITNSFTDGYLQDSGAIISELLPPMNIFSPDGEVIQKRRVVLDKLKAYFDRFFGIGGENEGFA
jgi:type I restriction enzyme R subunit